MSIPPQPAQAADARRRRITTLTLAFVSIGLAAVISAVMLFLARPFTAHELQVNLAAEFLGTAMVAFILTPLLIAFERRLEAILQRRGDIPESFANFQYNLYLQRLGSARSKIRIMDTSSGVLDPTDTTDAAVAASREACVAALRQAIERGVKVEILLIDPTSEAATRRSREVAGRGRSIAEGVKKNLALLNGMHKNSELTNVQRLLEVRLYDSSPGIAYYGIDDDAMVAFFMPDDISDQSQHIDFSVSSVYGRMTSEYFSRVWDSSRDNDFLRHLYPRVVIDGREPNNNVAGVEIRGHWYLSSLWDNAAEALLQLDVGKELELRTAAERVVCQVVNRQAITAESNEQCREVVRALSEKYGIDSYTMYVELEPRHVTALPTP
ncbi:DUF5919 domain-containing protein [Nocardia sp. NPDC127579]|uniref:DUF5919 domain-containing protein n=1 Tax=Nocardia sp. NPDC127579 TaxID=3345402 RepID=UPI00362EC1BA